MLISQGNLKVVLNEVKNEDDTTRAVWQAWLSDKLAGQVELSDWENSDVDFYSKQAGEILVDQFKETLAIAAELEDEASMEKTDDGVVKDIAPSPIESVEPEACCGQCDVPPGHDPCDETDSKKIIILHLNNLLDKAAALKLTEKPYEHVYKEIEAWLTNYESLVATANAVKINTLMEKIASDLADGLDCTAELDEVESLLK